MDFMSTVVCFSLFFIGNMIALWKKDPMAFALQIFITATLSPIVPVLLGVMLLVKPKDRLKFVTSSRDETSGLHASYPNWVVGMLDEEFRQAGGEKEAVN